MLYALKKEHWIILFLCVNSQSVTFVHFFPICHFNPFSPQSHRKSILIAIMFLQVLLCISISSFRYSNDSPELFQRKLGDLAFLVQNYELAYNSYHTAKRDFNNEHAWFYFAGALVSVIQLIKPSAIILSNSLKVTKGLKKWWRFGSNHVTWSSHANLPLFHSSAAIALFY